MQASVQMNQLGCTEIFVPARNCLWMGGSPDQSCSLWNIQSKPGLKFFPKVEELCILSFIHYHLTKLKLHKEYSNGAPKSPGTLEHLHCLHCLILRPLVSMLVNHNVETSAHVCLQALNYTVWLPGCMLYLHHALVRIYIFFLFLAFMQFKRVAEICISISMYIFMHASTVCTSVSCMQFDSGVSFSSASVSLIWGGKLILWAPPAHDNLFAMHLDVWCYNHTLHFTP